MFILKSVSNNARAVIRFTDVILQANKNDDITYIHVQKILDKENIDELLNDLFIYLTDLINKK